MGECIEPQESSQGGTKSADLLTCQKPSDMVPLSFHVLRCLDT